MQPTDVPVNNIEVEVTKQQRADSALVGRFGNGKMCELIMWCEPIMWQKVRFTSHISRQQTRVLRFNKTDRERR